MSGLPRPAWRGLSTFKTYTDEETGQTIIAGMGELHLEIIVDRLLREFKVEANVGKPQVSYKETITKPATVDTRFVRQTGGRGQFAHVKLTLEPNESGKGYEFVDDIHGGAIPKEYIPCVDQGIQGAMQAGILGGYQVVDVKATLIDGSFHEVDSSENAFRICGSMAFKEAMAKVRRMERITKEAKKVSTFPAFGRHTALELVMEAAHESKVARIVPAASPKVLELQRPDEEPLLKAVAGGPDLDTMNRNAMKRNGGAEHE